MKINGMKWMSRYAKKYNKHIALLTIMSAFTAICMIALALLSKYIIDVAISGDMNSLTKYIIAVVCVILAMVLLTCLSGSLKAYVFGNIKTAMKSDIHSKLLRKNYIEISKTHSGEYVNIMSSDIDIAANTYVSIIPKAISILLKVILGITILAVISWKLFLISIGAGLIAGMLTIIMRGKYKSYHTRLQESDGKVKAFMQESLQNIEVVKAFDMNEYINSKLNEKLQTYYSILVRFNVIMNSVNGLIFAVFNIAFYIMMVLGVLQIAGGTLTFGAFTAIIQLITILKDPFREATGIIPQYFTMSASIVRIKSIEEMTDDNTREKTELKSFDKIVFENVSYSYDNRTNVISEFDLAVNKGDKLAIIGASGEGKSTLIKLLLGLITPSRGEIYVIHNKRKYDLKALTNDFISYVPQGNLIMSGTVKDNLLIGRKDIDDTDMMNSCRAACLHDDIISLTDGYDTMLGENGYGMSQGQLQRLAIARALINNPQLIILDEATSALDEITEHKLLENLREIDVTFVCVSHKDNMIKFCDKTCNLTDYKKI